MNYSLLGEQAIMQKQNVHVHCYLIEVSSINEAKRDAETNSILGTFSILSLINN